MKTEKQTERAWRVGCAGGYGHTGGVFKDLSGWPQDRIRLCGVCPTAADEPVEGLLANDWAVASGARRYPSVAHLLGDDPPDILVVGTRLDRITEAARAGLAAGCHLILEKPLALDPERLQALYAAARQAGRQVMAMQSMRSRPAFGVAAACIAAGELGRVVLVNTRKSYKWGRRPPWYADRSVYGGTWPWVGFHNLDIAHLLTGRHATRVAALHANQGHPERAPGEDVCAGLFTIEGGILHTASIDLFRPEQAPTHGDDWCRVVGTEGGLEVNATTGVLRVLRGSEYEERAVPEGAAPIYRDWVTRLPQMAGQPPDPMPFQLTLAALLARDAADSGGVRDIPFPFGNQKSLEFTAKFTI